KRGRSRAIHHRRTAAATAPAPATTAPARRNLPARPPLRRAARRAGLRVLVRAIRFLPIDTAGRPLLPGPGGENASGATGSPGEPTTAPATAQDARLTRPRARARGRRCAR